jgi:hypothetical protein
MRKLFRVNGQKLEATAIRAKQDPLIVILDADGPTTTGVIGRLQPYWPTAGAVVAPKHTDSRDARLPLNLWVIRIVNQPKILFACFCRLNIRKVDDTSTLACALLV